MFLTPDELYALTGYRRPAWQIRWLRAQGIEPYISARGDVVITRDAVEAVLRQRSRIEPPPLRRRGVRPNLAAVT